MVAANAAGSGVMNAYGDLYPRVRDVLAWTDASFAKLLGIDAAIISNWNRGATPAPDEVVKALRDVSMRLPVAERVACELQVVAALAKETQEEIRRLSRFTTEDVVFNAAPFQAIPDHNRRSVAELKQLLQQAYGRVIRLRDVSTGEERFIRVAWGARSAHHQQVYSRTSGVIQRLMSVGPGRTITFGKPGELHEYDVVEVGLLDRHPLGVMQANLENFAQFDLAGEDGVLFPTVRELRDWLEQFRTDCEDAIAAGAPEAAVEPEPAMPVALTLETRSALSDRFFMSPLASQEEAMRWPARGHVLVEGVAGSGKTSVALGRSSFVCMPSEEDGEPYEPEYAPESGVGFVLSDQLVAYLQQMLSSNRLGLEKMPVQSFFMLRQRLIQERQLLVGGTLRAGADQTSDDFVVGTEAWLSAVDERMAARICTVLTDKLPQDPRSIGSKSALTDGHWAALDEPWRQFLSEVPRAFSARRVEKSLERIDEFRSTLATTLEHLAPWNRPAFREDRRRISERIRDAIVDAFRYAARYREIVVTDEFQDSVRRKLSGAKYALDAATIDASLSAAKLRALSSPLQLSNEDIDCLLVLAHRAALSYRGRGGSAKPIEHLAEFAYKTHVFIDEVQDFTEVQVLLMIAQADPALRCVTAVGDFAQRLSRGGLLSAARTMLAPENRIFLGHDKRQSAPLHALSQEVRARIYGDDRQSGSEPARAHDERPFSLGVDAASVQDGLFSALVATRERSPDFSTAVICPTGDSALALEASLHDRLWARNILSRVSDKADAAKLCDAYHVHFTTPLQAKGLEFDAVFAVGIDVYRLSEKPEQAALYVALSRARRRLGIGHAGPLAPALAEILARHVGPAPWGAAAAA